MKSHIRNKALKVKHGRTLPKNRLAETPSYENTPQEWPIIDRRKPGAGYRHVITIPQMEQFLGLLPDWTELSRGLNGIVLAEGDRELMGWHRNGVIGVCAWPRDMQQRWETGFVRDHQEILDRLGVACTDQGNKVTHCAFDEASARGFSLMHIFLHELGHHHDRMTTHSKLETARGEDYAEDYALRYSEQIWEDYFRVFGW
jgi:hypothetical protein